MAKSVYEMVTEKIIAQMEQGIIPWEKPWTCAINGAYNRVTKKPYSLINQLLLLHSGEYATFKQWQNLGGKIRKGEKSEMVVFWKPLPVEVKKEDGTTEIKEIPFLRYYNVFHISQVENVEPLETKKEDDDILPIDEAENLLNSYISRENIKLVEELSNDAYYLPTKDIIHLPLFNQFKNVNEYYSTAFHEAIHSTGHKTRLNRLESGKVAAFGTQEYSKEELVAEIGAANILNILGIETEKSSRNNVAYIQNWLQVLKNDVKFIVSASSKAEKATKYILGKENENEGN